MATTLLAILPDVGVAVGALLQHVLSRSGESRRHLQALRREAYVDYLRAVTKVARAKDFDASWEGRTALADAKARIAVYGATKVIQALAHFEEAGAFLRRDDSLAAFVALASSMREIEPASVEHLRLVLLGPDGADDRLPNQALQPPAGLPPVGRSGGRG